MRSLIFFFLTPLVLVACGDSNDTNVTAVQDLPAIQGSSAVGFTSFSANDAARADRELRVDVWYPVDDVDVIEGPGAFYSVSGSIIGITSDLATIDLPSAHSTDLIPDWHASPRPTGSHSTLA